MGGKDYWKKPSSGSPCILQHAWPIFCHIIPVYVETVSYRICQMLSCCKSSQWSFKYFFGKLAGDHTPSSQAVLPSWHRERRSFGGSRSKKTPRIIIFIFVVLDCYRSSAYQLLWEGSGPECSCTIICMKDLRFQCLFVKTKGCCYVQQNATCNVWFSRAAVIVPTTQEVSKRSLKLSKEYPSTSLVINFATAKYPNHRYYSILMMAGDY